MIDWIHFMEETFSFGCKSSTSLLRSFFTGLFQDYLLLESIVIPQSVIENVRCSFQWCTSLKTVEVPINLTHIVDYAFSVCLPLKKKEIPRSVKYIGDNAFIRSSLLKKIRIHFDTFRETVYLLKFWIFANIFFSNFFEFSLIFAFLQKVKKFTKIWNVLQTIFCFQKGLINYG